MNEASLSTMLSCLFVCFCFIFVVDTITDIPHPSHPFAHHHSAPSCPWAVHICVDVLWLIFLMNSIKTTLQQYALAAGTKVPKSQEHLKEYMPTGFPFALLPYVPPNPFIA